MSLDIRHSSETEALGKLNWETQDGGAHFV